MRYFLFISLVVCFSACSRPYKDLVLAGTGAQIRASDLQPRFQKALYRCEVNGRFLFKKFHLSGLLFFKILSDSSTRVVFQNEMGLTYFDFGWDSQDSFQVNKVIDQMNKPALIRTLKKDFEILLAKNLDWKSQQLYRDEAKNRVFRLNLGEGFIYYIIDQKEAYLRGIENAGVRKKVTLFQFGPETLMATMPEQVNIRHLRAHFTIDLKKLNVDETP